MVFGHSQENL